MPDNSSTSNNWMRVDQAAKYLSDHYGGIKVSATFVRRLIQHGKLPFVRVGKVYLVESTDLDKCIQGMKQTGKHSKKKK